MRLTFALAEIPEAADGPPTVIPLIPPPDSEGLVRGVDGRRFLPDLEAIVANFRADKAKGREPCLDWGHGSEISWMAEPDRGGKAAAWIKDLEIREDRSLWGSAEYTDLGRDDLTRKLYRYISPTVWVDEDGRAHRLSSAALTNNPNLTMPAVHRAGEPDQGSPTMSAKTVPLALLCSALALPADTSEDAAIAAAKAHREAATAPPDPTKFAPREELHAARLELAELAPVVHAARDAFDMPATAKPAEIAAKLAEHKGAQLNSAIDEAVKAGKIAPASADHYRRTFAAVPDGRKRFAELVETMPAVVSTHAQAGGSPPPKTGENIDEAEAAKRKRLAQAANLSAESTAELLGKPKTAAA